MDRNRGVDAPVLLRYHLDLCRDHGVLRRPLSRRLLPLLPGVEATAGHIQLLVQLGE